MSDKPSFRLNFFKLIVSDLDAAQRFYTDAFGLEQRDRIETEQLEEVMLAMPGERFNLVLYRHKDGRALDIGSAYGPVGFVTRDLDAAHAHLLALGAKPVRAPFAMGSMRIAFVTDPEGHEIELIQIVRPQSATA